MLLTAWLSAIVLAQAPPAWTVSLFIEPARESIRYRFDNPSSFDTDRLVPHFFEQTYDTDNIWMGGRIVYGLFGRSAETRVAATPRATRRADDFDTFFQPDGNIVTSGTTGDASVRGWQIVQRMTADRLLGADVGVTFAYRRDTARYHEGTGIVTTTRPPTETRRLVTTREFTTSQLFEAGVFGARASGSISAGIDIVAVGVGRLAVELPDKYPGRTITASGRYSSAAVEGVYTRSVGPAVVRAGIRARASTPWRRTAAMHHRRVSLFVMIGMD